MNTMLNGLNPAMLSSKRIARDTSGIVTVDFNLTSPTVDNFDWNEEGAVNPVRNQGACACCYAIASTGAIEGQIFRRENFLIKLSDQQLIDCGSAAYYMNGCNMGSILGTFRYVIDNGIAMGFSYPFKARATGTCKYNQATMSFATLKAYHFVDVESNEFLRDLLYTIGPLAVGVDASLPSFLSYASGVYDDQDCTGPVNHAMLLTGFGIDPDFGPYWKLRNSYSKSWGEEGYIRMTMNISNVCGLWNYVAFPVLSDLEV